MGACDLTRAEKIAVAKALAASWTRAADKAAEAAADAAAYAHHRSIAWVALFGGSGGGGGGNTVTVEEEDMGDSHRRLWVYPTVGAGGAGWVPGVQIPNVVAPGTFDAYVEVIPAGWAAATFTLTALNVEVGMMDLALPDITYELVIATGLLGAEVERARVRFTRTDLGAGLAKDWIVNQIPLKTEMLPAGSRISAMWTSSAVAPALSISVQGHYYD